jgi:hypothetical protein
MAQSTSEIITMAKLEAQCRDRLDHARRTGEAAVHMFNMPGGGEGIEVVEFETSTGVEIKSFGGDIGLRCDFSELDYDAPQSILTIDFNPPGTAPEATDVITTDEGITSKTTPLKNHNVLAAEISRLVGLVI